MQDTVLWQVRADGAPLFRCVLERRAEAQYRLYILKGKAKDSVFEHDYPDRLAAIEASITLYRRFKDNGFYDTPRPV